MSVDRHVTGFFDQFRTLFGEHPIHKRLRAFADIPLAGDHIEQVRDGISVVFDILHRGRDAVDLQQFYPAFQHLRAVKAEGIADGVGEIPVFDFASGAMQRIPNMSLSRYG